MGPRFYPIELLVRLKLLQLPKASIPIPSDPKSQTPRARLVQWLGGSGLYLCLHALQALAQGFGIALISHGPTIHDDPLSSLCPDTSLCFEHSKLASPLVTTDLWASTAAWAYLKRKIMRLCNHSSTLEPNMLKSTSGSPQSGSGKLTLALQLLGRTR